MDTGSTSLLVESPTSHAGLRLIEGTRRFFIDRDEDGLCAFLKSHWTRSALRGLLQSEQAEVAQTAAMCLGLVGEFKDSAALARGLHHDDYFVVTTVEQALWAIWFRATSAACRDRLRQAIECMHAGAFSSAEQLLDKILIDDPDFAEAINQRAVLHFLTRRHESSIMACRRTLALNPHHFGAAAGLGHNHFELGQYEAAIKAYHHTLALHPRKDGIRQMLRRAREALAQPGNELTGAPVLDKVLSLQEALTQAKHPTR